jgi:hypothetical protein
MTDPKDIVEDDNPDTETQDDGLGAPPPDLPTDADDIGEDDPAVIDQPPTTEDS